MRGTSSWQVRELFKGISKIGESKHVGKEAARADGARTWHEIGLKIGVHSYATLDQYRDVSRHCMDYARDNFAIKDIEKLTPQVVKSFLESKVDQNVKYSTFQQYCAVMEKLGTALTAYSANHGRGGEYNFSPAIAEARKEAQATLDRYQAPRAYENPQAIRENIPNPEHQIAAALQHESGLRVSAATYVTTAQFQDRPKIGAKEKIVLGENQIWIKNKGGKQYAVQLTPETYRVLKAHVAAHDGKFEVKQNPYRTDIKQAATATGQLYAGRGSHGLRWNFAQDRVAEKQDRGNASHHQALGEVSNEMGHHRLIITEHYLR